MTPPRSEGYVRMPDAEFEAIMTRAAEEGARRALADVGLDGDEAVLDIRDLRSLVDCVRLVRRTAMQTAVRMITIGVMLALLAGIAIKLKTSAAARSRSPYLFISPTGPANVAGFSFLDETVTTTFCDHWRDVPDGTWAAWPNFSPAEIACRGTSKLLINAPALVPLRALHDPLRRRLIVLPQHEAQSGRRWGESLEHMMDIASDVAMVNHDPRAFETAARPGGRQGFMALPITPRRRRMCRPLRFRLRDPG